jgi:hypothetical protein
MFLRSIDGGKTWRAKPLGITNRLNTLVFSDTQHGVLAGDRILLFTGDGGRLWTPASLGRGIAPANWQELVIDASGFGVCRGSTDEFIQTTDFGTNWMTVQPSAALQHETNTFYTGMCLVSPSILAGFPRPVPNIIQNPNQQRPLNSSLEGARGIVLANKNLTAFEIDPQTQSWNLVGHLPLRTNIRSSATRILAISDSRLAIGSSMGPAGILDFDPPRPVAFRITDSSFFGGTLAADGAGQLWGVTIESNLVAHLEKRYGGKGSSFVERISVTDVTSDLKLAWAGTNGLAMFDRATIARSSDGFHWEHPTEPYRVLPPPATWVLEGLFLLTACGLLFFAPVSHVVKTSLAAHPVSDAPLDDPANDQLGFRPLAQSLASFLRNSATKPPWVIAVTGDWGTGKSSLMGMVRNRLRNYHFPAVWFNAWHYQNESHILPPLLNAVVQDAVPGWFEYGAWKYRRLLWEERARKHPIKAAGLAAAVLGLAVLTILVAIPSAAPSPDSTPVVSAPVSTTHMSVQARDRTNTNAEDVASIIRKGIDVQWEAPRADDAAGASEGVDSLPFVKELRAFVRGHPWWQGLLTLLLPIAGVAYKVWASLKSFGLDPKRLIPSSEAGGPDNVRVDMGLQQRFAVQFGEVTDAMGDRQLVIFIDDLDRCQPEKVAQMLEAINFLTVSGKCFVVLGFAREQVEAAVGLGFSKMAAEMQLWSKQGQSSKNTMANSSAAPTPPPSQAEIERNNRRAFACQYLKKLINMEIKVPVPNNSQLAAMLFGGRLPGLGDGNGTPHQNAEARPHLPAAPKPSAAMAALFLILTLGLASPALSVDKTSGTYPPAATNAPPIPAQNVQAANPKKPPPAFTLAGRQFWWLFLPSLLLVWAFDVARRTPAQDKFLEPVELGRALEVWTPWIRPRFLTPREGKRYVNLVRYVVMRAIEEQKDPTLKNKPPPLKPEDAVYASATSLRLPPKSGDPDFVEFKECLRHHYELLHSEPGPAAKESFARLSSDVVVN